MTLMRWKPQQDLWDPFGSLTEIQNEMNRLFDTSLHRFGGATLAGAFAPALDVREQGDNLIINAELPGMTKDDVTVTLQDNLLTIRGEKKHETDEKTEGYHHQERIYGAFSRTIELPVAVDTRKIDAAFKNGVLTISLPRSEEAKPRQIEVKVS